MKKNRKTANPSPVFYILAVILLMLLVFLSAYRQNRNTAEASLTAISVAAAFLIGIPFSVLVHEAGHLLFGLATGYRLVSFRLFSLILKKKSDRWRICREPAMIAGIAGQCLMAPPRKKNGRFPYRLYNVGGVVLGLATAAALLAAALLFCRSFQLYLFLFVTGVYGLIVNLFNAVPTSGKHVVNDGTNARAAKRSPVTREALWNQLEYTALQAEGVRTREMPEELFFLPEAWALSNALTVTEGMMLLDRYEDTGAYEDARGTAAYLLENAHPLLPVYRASLTAEMLFFELILRGDSDEIARLYSETEKNLPLLKNHATAYRVLYAYHLLSSGDASAAADALARFESLAARNPVGTLPDRDLIAYTQTLYQNRKEG